MQRHPQGSSLYVSRCPYSPLFRSKAVGGVRAAGDARAAIAGACDVGLGLGIRDWGFGRPGSLCFPALPNPQSRIPNPASSSERIPELLPELPVELVEVEALVLRPRVFDLRST